MKTYILAFLFALFTIYPLFAQVGIGTTAPQANLDVSASDQGDPLNIDGFLLPRVDKFPTDDPTASQNSMLIYVTGDETDREGFYRWNEAKSSWLPLIREVNDLEDGKSDADGTDNGSSLFLGLEAGRSDDGSDNRNIGIGYRALRNTTTGENNMAIGYEAYMSNITGSSNVAFGNSTLRNNSSGQLNVAIGFEALRENTTGTDNVGLGASSLRSNTTGNQNTALGKNALLSNISGYQNTAVGGFSMSNNTTGYQNAAIGPESLQGNTTGIYNLAMGFQTLKKNTVGNFNTAIGVVALTESETGSNNVAIGTAALNKLTAGSRNTAIGRGTNAKLTSGNENTMLGFEAGLENLTGSGNVFLGSKAGREELGSNLLYIETTTSTTPLIGGNFSNNRVGINRPIGSLTNTFEVGGTASKATSGSWLANSDRRLKNNIETISGETALEKIAQMRGVYFEWNDDKTGITRPAGKQLGFIAQELMEVFPDKVDKDHLGYYQTAYGDYDAIYVQAIKELTSRLKEKDAQLDALISRLDQLEARLSK